MNFRRRNHSLPSLTARQMIGIAIVFATVLITVTLALVGAEILLIGWRAGGMPFLRAFFFDGTILDSHHALNVGVLVAAVAAGLTVMAIEGYHKLRSSAEKEREISDPNSSDLP